MVGNSSYKYWIFVSLKIKKVQPEYIYIDGERAKNKFKDDSDFLFEKLISKTEISEEILKKNFPEVKEFIPCYDLETLEHRYQKLLSDTIERFGADKLLNVDRQLTQNEISAKKRKRVNVNFTKQRESKTKIKSKKVTEKANIFFDFTYLTYGTKFGFYPEPKIQIDPYFFDKEVYRINLERVKKSIPSELIYYEKVNNDVEAIQDTIISEYHKFLDNNGHDPSKEVLKSLVENKIKVQKVITPKIKKDINKKAEGFLVESFSDFINSEILQPATINLKKEVLNHLKAFLIHNHLDTKKFRILDFSDEYDELFKSYLIEKKFLNSTINYYFIILKSLFKKFNIEKKYKNLKTIKIEKEFLTARELEIFKNIEVIKPTQILVKDICLFSTFTGLRISDILKLKNHNVKEFYNDFSGKTEKIISISVEKTSKILKIPFLKEAEELFKKHNYDFSKGGDMNRIKVNNHIKTILQKDIYFHEPVSKKQIRGANQKMITKPRYDWFSIHVFRHSFASLLQSKNISVSVIKEILGHADIKTTLGYLHANEKETLNSMFKAFEN